MDLDSLLPNDMKTKECRGAISLDSEIDKMLLALERNTEDLLSEKDLVARSMQKVIRPGPEVIEGRVYLPRIPERGSEIVKRLSALNLRIAAATLHLRDLNKRIEL